MNELQRHLHRIFSFSAFSFDERGSCQSPIHLQYRNQLKKIPQGVSVEICTHIELAHGCQS